ncbi:FG-GAP-like repeat-containing protein [Mucilaginibacter sp. UYCu711]|uniref:FG-GAP-like repeat-containing protein n=1 Tax=Mucilaginibacter sp. UYCu711 TaxID=3156339 RepID=UPI003D1E7EE2
MKQYKVGFIPEKLIQYTNTTDTDNIAISWAFRPEYIVGFYPIPVVDDTDNDGKPEVYLGSYTRNIYALDGKSGNTLWKWKLPFGVVGGRVVDLFDLDGDGKKELVFGTHTTLPIRVYALKTGKQEDDKRMLWATNLSGDFLEGGLTVSKLNGEPVVVAITRDAPYSRGTINVIKADGSFLFPSIAGVDDCASRPAVGLLPANKYTSIIHGSHAVYNAQFADRIIARDLKTGKMLWMSPKIGDTGFQNHQLLDVDFDGKNDVVAFADSTDVKEASIYIINGLNGTIVKQVPWSVQGVLKDKKQLIVCQDDKTMCLNKRGDVLYTIPKISFGVHTTHGQIVLFAISYNNKFLTINEYDVANGKLLKTYNCPKNLPDHIKKSDYGIFIPKDSAAFLTLADTDNDGNWDCLIQVKDFIVNVKLPIKVQAGTEPYAPIALRNVDNSGVIY